MIGVLPRGGNVPLTRENPGLDGVVFGVRFTTGAEKALADSLVVAAILCDDAQKALSPGHLVFFNQLTSPDLSVRALEEALGTDDEQIEVDLLDVPPEVSRIVVVLYVNEGTVGRRTLGQLRSCVIRVLNLRGNAEMVRSEDLAAGLVQETALGLGELYRHQGGWKFKVLGDRYAGGVTAVAGRYGVRL